MQVACSKVHDAADRMQYAALRMQDAGGSRLLATCRKWGVAGSRY